MKTGEITIAVPFTFAEVKEIEAICDTEEIARGRFVRKIFMKTFVEICQNKKKSEKHA